MKIREFAKIAQVSPATVSIVMNGKEGVSDETRIRVLQLAEEYGYAGGKVSFQRTKNVIVLKYWKEGTLVEENQSFVSTIIDAIEGELHVRKHGLTMIVSKNNLADSLREINYSDFCGMIIVATEIQDDLYHLFENISIPFVVVDNTVPKYKYNSVCVDNTESVYLAVKCLKEYGHQQIGYFRSAFQTENFVERNSAFLKWVQELGLDFEPKNEYSLTPTLVGAYEDLKRMIADRKKMPSCIFADNDTIALGAIKALKEKGYKVPGDISVVGIDDIPFASVSSPALTTVSVPKGLIGKEAVCQLFRLSEDAAYAGVKVRVSGDLVIRSSVSNQLE